LVGFFDFEFQYFSIGFSAERSEAAPPRSEIPIR